MYIPIYVYWILSEAVLLSFNEEHLVFNRKGPNVIRC